MGLIRHRGAFASSNTPKGRFDVHSGKTKPDSRGIHASHRRVRHWTFRARNGHEPATSTDQPTSCNPTSDCGHTACATHTSFWDHASFCNPAFCRKHTTCSTHTYETPTSCSFGHAAAFRCNPSIEAGCSGVQRQSLAPKHAPGFECHGAATEVKQKLPAQAGWDRRNKGALVSTVRPEWPLVRPLDSYGFSERFFLPIAVISMLDFPELVAVAR